MYDVAINSVNIYRRMITLRVMNCNPAYKQVFALMNTEDCRNILSLTLQKPFLSTWSLF